MPAPERLASLTASRRMIAVREPEKALRIEPARERGERGLHRQLLGGGDQFVTPVDERERHHFSDGDDAEAGAAAGEEACRPRDRRVRELFERAKSRPCGAPRSDAIECRRPAGPGSRVQ